MSVQRRNTAATTNLWSFVVTAPSHLLKKLDPVFLVGRVPDDVGAADVAVALDDDGQEGAEHDDGLEGVCPHDSLDAALKDKVSVRSSRGAA